jgi:hypothetical protein
MLGANHNRSRLLKVKRNPLAAVENRITIPRSFSRTTLRCLSLIWGKAKYRNGIHEVWRQSSSLYGRSIPGNSFTFTWPFIVTNLFITKPTRCINFPNLLRQFLCPSSGVYSLYTRHWDMSYRFVDSCLQTCMTYTIAEYTVNKLLMMCRGTVRNM